MNYSQKLPDGQDHASISALIAKNDPMSDDEWAVEDQAMFTADGTTRIAVPHELLNEVRTHILPPAERLPVGLFAVEER